MKPDRRRSLARTGAVGAAALILAGAGVLTVDYARARLRSAGDARRLETLQAAARSEPAAARTLETEHDRITRARQARQARADALAVVLIAASAVFIGCAKWSIAQGPRRPAPPANLIKVRVPRPQTAAAAPARSPTQNGPAATAVDLAFVDDLVAKEGRSPEAAIPILQAIQAHYRYLPDDALRRVCQLTDITPAQMAGTSSFYARFRRSPTGEHVVRVCHGTACHVAGARQITDELRRHLEIADDADTDEQRLFTIAEVACVGCCSLAPVVMVDAHTTGSLTPDTAHTALAVVARPGAAAEST